MTRIAVGAITTGRRRSPKPRSIRMRVALGPSWMPAPVSSSFSACSKTVARKPARAMAIAAVSPAMPAPATMTWRSAAMAFIGNDQAVAVMGSAHSAGLAACGSRLALKR